MGGGRPFFFVPSRNQLWRGALIVRTAPGIKRAGAPKDPGPGGFTAGSSGRAFLPHLYQPPYPQQYEDQFDHYQRTDRSFHGYGGRSAKHSSTPPRSPAVEKAPHHTPPLSRAFPRYSSECKRAGAPIRTPACPTPLVLWGVLSCVGCRPTQSLCTTQDRKQGSAGLGGEAGPSIIPPHTLQVGGDGLYKTLGAIEKGPGSEVMVPVRS